MADSQQLWEALSKALDTLETEYGSQIIGEVRPVVRTSHQKRRVHKVLERNPDWTALTYARHVTVTYLENRERLYRLRVLHDEATWQPLLIMLRTTAVRELIKHRSQPARIDELADGSLHDAYIRIVHIHYPYDTPFEGWAVVVLRNIIRKNRQRYLAANGHTRNALYLEDLDIEQIAFDNGSAEEQALLRQILEQALSQLNERQAAVIRYHYLESRPLDEVATLLDTTIQSVYALNKRAKNKLRLILRGFGNNK